MMSLEVIRSLAREQGNRARRHGVKPFIIWTEDLEDWKATLAIGNLPRMPFPNMRAYVPAGWKPTGREWFCDKFGEGDNGRSTSARGLVEQLEVGKAYAITEEGEFQLYVSEFESPQQYPKAKKVAKPFSPKLTSAPEAKP